MDPNATLDSIRELIAGRDRVQLDSYDADTLADLIDALDDWLSHGGFLPEAWKR